MIEGDFIDVTGQSCSIPPTTIFQLTPKNSFCIDVLLHCAGHFLVEFPPEGPLCNLRSSAMDANDENSWNGEEDETERPIKQGPKKEKKGNTLPIWGNERTMNMNPLILTNIQSSHYFKVNLYELKTYHEVIDEIYYKVQHMEPWEKGSRKTAGQTGMCGGVRGVGAGGIVSTAYCLLYKLFTLKLTRKQVNGLITHQDSPYIRGLGFMYIRYTQPPADLWDWYDEYLEDEEEIDVKAGGGQIMTIGSMLRIFLTKLEWFSTLFPRIPVPIQQNLERKMAKRFPHNVPIRQPPRNVGGPSRPVERTEDGFGEAEKFSKHRRDSPNGGPPFSDGSSFLRDSYRERDVKPHRDRDFRDGDRSRDRDRDRERDRERERYRGGDRERERDRYKGHGHSRDRSRSRDRDRERDRDRHYGRDKDRYRERDHREQHTSRDRHRSSSYR
ncbi:Pre-mRNA-splicing factor 38B [Frankliniella fusca]|uniref:Pre-mRNA-splicing factor 38 n=1 Tax=Frankliniella fusca TaxID=407009 RepID=A0AAE1HVA6_9NEOP|nr:Pre-mRNA-splicing factor 38B [Frankliniella fusca]